MRLRIPLAATVAAALLWIAPPALAVGTSSVTSPADGSSYAYDVASAPTIAVSGTASGMAAVDLRCAYKYVDTWYFEPPLAGGVNVPVSGGTFSAASVSLSTADNALCRLVAVPTGTTPSDLTGLSGPALRLVKVADDLDANGGANNGKQYDFFASVGGGATADAYLSSAGDDGLDATYLVTGDPSEQGEVFSSSGYIPELDPTAPTSSGDGPLTGMLVDGVNAFTGYEWENGATTGTTRIPFSNYTPFPLVTVTHSTAADGSAVIGEHDLVSECFGADPMYYPPGGFTCQGLQDSGVALDVTTTFSPAGNVVDRLWRLSSADGRAHAVALWMANTASFQGSPREWRAPGGGAYATHSSGDVVTPPASGPWAAEFRTAGAADGDTGEGVGAIAADAVPSALRFDDAETLDGKFDVAVPATGAAQIDTVYMSEAGQAALDADVAAALARLAGRGSGGGGDGGRGGDNNPPPASGVPAPRLTRTGKALLALNRTLSLGYALACPAAAASPPCYATVTLTQPVRRAARRHARAHKSAKRRRPARRARLGVLGRVQVQVAPGGTLVLKLRIARRNLAAFKAGHITLTARLTRLGTATQTITKPLPVQIAKPKPRRRRAHRKR